MDGNQAFFETLADAVEVFRSGHALPGANCKGCLFVRGKGKKSGTIRFGFIAKGDNIVTVDIVAREIVANPKEYIENMLEAINQGLQQMDSDVNIIVPAPKQVIH
ncbi:MAG: hypothetical protein KDA17_03800 [Candidatus Saccharibacteria bacterium]|nr:hypothetical protein [Candidatus Saccharibacteria bacterium]